MSETLQQREQGLKVWVSQTLALRDAFAWETVAGDASFRRYFRAKAGGQNGEPLLSWIAVDSPYDHEHNDAFIDVLERLTAAGVDVPKQVALNREDGYFLLSDLGDQLLLPLLNEKSVDQWYQASMGLLMQMQQTAVASLPHYDREKLRQEMNLFHEWLLPKYLEKEVDAQLLASLEQVYSFLEEEVLAQPHCFVHRDYHPRNLMVTDVEPYHLSVIDFQDAVEGAITYDLVSMLKNSYYKRPLAEVDRWALQYRQMLLDQNHLAPEQCSEQQWMRWFDFMGMQRHIKVVGIFARLGFRDSKTSFLADIPRTLSYLLEMTQRYRSELEWFDLYLHNHVVPALIERDPAAARWFENVHLLG